MLKVLITAAIVMIAFRVNEHYWLINLLGGYVITAHGPIAVLALAVLIFQLFGMGSRPGTRSIAAAWVPLFLYVSTATVSLIVHEPTIDALITWLAYIWSPVLIFVSILWLPALNSDKALRDCVRVLIVAGLLFSLHAMDSFAWIDVDSPVPAALQTNQGERPYFTTYASGYGGVHTIRWTVPGLNTSHFAPMLLPLVFLGLLLARQAEGFARVAYLIAAAVLTLTIAEGLSRGAMIPLIAGLLYLGYVKWYRWLGTLAVCAGMVAVLVTQPLMLARIVMTIGSAVPVQNSMPAWTRDLSILAPFRDAPFVSEEHFRTNAYTIRMMFARPVLGYGWTNFTEEQSEVLAGLSGKDHNNYLSIGAAFGVPALVFYVCFIMGLGLGLRRIIRGATPGSDVWQTAHIWGATLLGYALYLVAEPAEFHFVWVWFGLIGAWVRNQSHSINRARTTDARCL